MKLTKEQAQIVAENHNLIFWYINLKHLDIDEWYDILALELCQAVLKYNPERGQLSTYFKLRADGIVYKEYRKQMNKKDNVQQVEFFENQHSSYTEDLDEKLDMEAWMENETNREILELKWQGFNQTEIANIVGLTQSHVSKILKGMKKNYDANYR